MKRVYIPDCGGERPRLPSAQVGPVTQAIRAMRRPPSGELCHLNEPAEKSRKDCDSTAFGHSAFTLGIRALSRTEVEDLIGGLIDLLDAMDGDTDREPEVLEASAAEWPGRGAHRFNAGEAA